VGKSEADNVEVRRVGEPRQFDFAPKAHWDSGRNWAFWIWSGRQDHRCAVCLYWDMGAKLERALINFMLDVHTREHGYTEVLPPFMVNSRSLFGTGQLPKFKEELFKCEGQDLWLIPTAEVPVTNIYAGETLEADALPVSCAPTRRVSAARRAPTADVRGIIRVTSSRKWSW